MAESSVQRMEMAVESLTDLPPNILLEILARLPLKALHASRCVCRLFLDLTSPNPHFIALHSTLNTAQTLVIQLGNDDNPSKFLRWTDPEDDVVGSRGRKMVRLKALLELPENPSNYMMMYRSSYNYENKYFLVNSCNGLVYFAEIHSRYGGSLVCNPVTNEYVIIPDVDRPLSETRMMILGYSVGSNRYKVLRVFHTGTLEEVRGQVQVVGSGSWTDVEDTPLGHDHSWDSFPVYSNGSTYWPSSLEGIIVVHSFDFESEKFGLILLPHEFGDERLNIREHISIGMLGGCLCVSNNVHYRHLDLWLLKRQGDQESWSKAFVIDTERPIGRCYYGLLRPLQVLSNGEILMLWENEKLVCCDPKSKGLREFRFHWLIKSVAGFVPSFVSLKDALSVDKVMVQYTRPDLAL